MEHNVVVSSVAVVGFRDELAADGDLSGEADDGASNIVSDEGVDGVVDVAWVGGVEGTEYKEDFAGAV